MLGLSSQICAIDVKITKPEHRKLGKIPADGQTNNPKVPIFMVTNCLPLSYRMEKISKVKWCSQSRKAKSLNTKESELS